MVSEKRKRLKSRPAEVSLVCVSKEERPLVCLAKSLQKKGIGGGSLISAGGLCLGLRMKTELLITLLPQLCELSDVVCIGSCYPELFAEHGEVIIKHDALKILSSY